MNGIDSFFEENKILIGKKVRSLREKKGYNQQTFAVRCGLTTAIISGIENGRSNTTIYSLTKISYCFGIPIKELFA